MNNNFWCEICNMHVLLNGFQTNCPTCNAQHLKNCCNNNCSHEANKVDIEKIKYQIIIEELNLINEFLIKLGYNKRKNIKQKQKSFILQRDNYKCVKCNSNVNLHIDHIIPVTKGGKNINENLQVLCRTCNLAKSNRNAIQYTEV